MPSMSGNFTASRSTAPRRTAAAGRSPSASVSARKPSCARPSSSASGTSTASCMDCWSRSGGWAMRPNPLFASEDPELVRALVREHPWATLVTETASGLAASHYPVLLDEEAEGLTLLTHLGRPDEEVLEIEQGEVLVIVQGHHG